MTEDSTYNQNEIQKIEELNSCITITEQKIRLLLEKYSNYTRIILLGSTGVGKSSLANAILGWQLQINEKSNHTIYLTCSHKEFEMGHTMRAETTIPNIYADEENHLLICDAPGFDDNRGTNQDIVNSFAINQLFDCNSKIKIIFVFSAQQASINGGRGHDVMVNLERITQIIPDKRALQKAMSIVVSNGDPNLTENILSTLVKGHPKSVINEWIGFILKNKKEKMFSFPRASIKQVGKDYVFKDRERLIRSLQNSPVKNMEHNIILSSEAINSVHQLSMKYGTIDDMLNEIIKKCRTIYWKDEIQIDELKEWLHSFKAIINESKYIKTPKDLAILIRQKIKRCDIINDEINKLICYQSMFTFMNKIENFGKYKDTIEDQAYDMFENEIKTIKDKIMHLQTHESNLKLKQKCESQSEEITALQKTSEENIRKRNEIQANINQLKDQVELSSQKTTQLQNDLAEKNQQLQKKIEESNEIVKLIIQLNEEMSANQHKNNEEIALLNEKLNNSIHQFVGILNDLDERQRIESIGKFFGPFSPCYHLGVKIGMMIGKKINKK